MGDKNTDNIYGENAVTGNPEESTKILEGRDVVIKSSTSQQININENTTIESEVKVNEESKEDNKEEPSLSPEEQLDKDVKKTMQAEIDVKADLETRGINFDDLSREFETTGGLSEKSYEALQKAGYPKSAVDAYITGMSAVAERFENQVYEYTGGKDGFTQMAQFIQAQGPSDIDAFNKVIQTGDLNQIKLIIEGVQAKMTKTYGTRNQTLMGSGNVSVGQLGFSNKQEMITAMSDPRYLRDPQYTQEVRTKAMKSSFL